MDLTQHLLAILSNHQTDDSSHGLDHIKRVWANVKIICNNDQSSHPDMNVLQAATFLHDLINPPKNDPLRSQASSLSAKKAIEYLRPLQLFSPDQLERISHAIESHSFSANIEPKTLEAQILQDADRLEALGTIGIARCFYTAGRLGSQLFNQDDPFAKNRPLDDSKYAVDHFENKLFKLPAMFKTDAGKNEALKRTEIMREMLRSLAHELNIQ